MQSYNFYNVNAVTKFANTVSGSHGKIERSPFILYAIHVEEPPEVEVGRYWQNLAAILTKQGGHLREFSFSVQYGILGLPSPEVDDDYPEYQYFSRNLIKCLDSLTNITYLNVEGRFETPEILTSEQRKQYGYKTIIPKCPKLTKLRMDRLSDPCFVIQKCLLTPYAEQLIQLHFRISGDAYSLCVPTKMPFLKELYILVESIEMAETFTSRLRASRHPPKLIRFGLQLKPNCF